MTNKLRHVFSRWPGDIVMPGAVERQTVSASTWRSWTKRGWVEKRGLYMLTLAGWRAMI